MYKLPKINKLCIKATITGIICLFLLNDISFALQPQGTSTLATQSMFNPLTNSEIQDIGFLKALLVEDLLTRDDFFVSSKDRAIRIENNLVFQTVKFHFTQKEVIRKNGILVPCVINRRRHYYAYITQSPHDPANFNVTVFTKADKIKHQRKTTDLPDITIADIGLAASEHEPVVNKNIRALIDRGHETVEVKGFEDFEIHVIGDESDMFIDEEKGQRSHAGGISTAGSTHEVKRLWITKSYFEKDPDTAVNSLRHEATELDLWWTRTEELLKNRMIRAPDDTTSDLPIIREWMARNYELARTLQFYHHQEAQRRYPVEEKELFIPFQNIPVFHDFEFYFGRERRADDMIPARVLHARREYIKQLWRKRLAVAEVKDTNEEIYFILTPVTDRTCEVFTIQAHHGGKTLGYADVVANTMKYGFLKSRLDEIMTEDGGPELAAIGTYTEEFRGVGRALMILAMRIAKENGYNKFVLLGANEDALKFYHDLGFRGDKKELTFDFLSKPLPEIGISRRFERKSGDGNIASCLKDMRQIKAAKTLKQLVQIRGKSETTVRMELKMLEALGLVEKEGKGIRGDPYKYRLTPVINSATSEQIEEICGIEMMIDGKNVKIMDRYGIPSEIITYVRKRIVEMILGWETIDEKARDSGIQDERDRLMELRGPSKEGLVEYRGSDVTGDFYNTFCYMLHFAQNNPLADRRTLDVAIKRWHEDIVDKWIKETAIEPEDDERVLRGVYVDGGKERADAFFSWVYADTVNGLTQKDPFEFCAKVYHRVSNGRFFEDGNDEIAFLVMNYFLILNMDAYLEISKENLEALRDLGRGDVAELEAFLKGKGGASDWIPLKVVPISPAVCLKNFHFHFGAREASSDDLAEKMGVPEMMIRQALSYLGEVGLLDLDRDKRKYKLKHPSLNPYQLEAIYNLRADIDGESLAVLRTGRDLGDFTVEEAEFEIEDIVKNDSVWPLLRKQVRFENTRGLLEYHNINMLTCSEAIWDGNATPQKFVLIDLLNMFCTGRTGTWVDVGSGYNIALREAKRRFGDNIRAYGVDIVNWNKWLGRSSLIQETIKARVGNNIFDSAYDVDDFTECDAAEVRLPRGADVVTSFHMLQHTSDPLGNFLNLYNQMQDGAVLMVSISEEAARAPCFKDLFETLKDFLIEIGDDVVLGKVKNAPWGIIKDGYDAYPVLAVRKTRNIEVGTNLVASQEPIPREHYVEVKYGLKEPGIESLFVKNSGEDEKDYVAMAENDPVLARLMLEVDAQEKCLVIEEDIREESHETLEPGAMTATFWAMDVEESVKVLVDSALEESGGDIIKARDIVMKKLKDIPTENHGEIETHWWEGALCIHNDILIGRPTNKEYGPFKNHVYFFGVDTDRYTRVIRPLLGKTKPVVSGKKCDLKYDIPSAPSRFIIEEMGISSDQIYLCQSIGKFDLYSFENGKKRLLCYDSYPLILQAERESAKEEINLLQGLGDELFEDSELYSYLSRKSVLGRCLFDIFDIGHKKDIRVRWKDGLPYLTSVFTESSKFTEAFYTFVAGEVKDGKYLDLGCGTGIIAVQLAMYKGVNMDAIDINPYAVACTRGYAAHAGVGDQVRAWQSDGLSNVHEKYDAIFFNAPHVQAKRRSYDIAYEDIGGKLLEAVFKDLRKNLKEDGSLYIMINPGAPVDELAKEYGLTYEEVHSPRGLDAVIYRVRIRYTVGGMGKGSVGECLKELYKLGDRSGKEYVDVRQLAGARGRSETTVRMELKMLDTLGLLVKAGKGVKGDPYKYRLAPTIGGLTFEQIERICEVRIDLNGKNVRILDRYEIPSDMIPHVQTRIFEAIQGIIHEENMDLTPAIPERKILWHIVANELIPDLQQNMGLVTNINQMSRRTDSREKIRIVYEGENLEDVVRKLIQDPKNIVHVILNNETQVDRMPENVKMAVFKGELGNYTQLEGMLAVSRVLDIEDRELRNSKLRYLYKMLTGVAFHGEIPDTDDPKELAMAIIFTLPKATILDHQELQDLNSNLIRLLQSA